MADSSTTDRMLMQRSRRAALIIAVAMVVWMGAQAIGGWLNWDPRMALIFDLAAAIALICALWIVYGIYRVRRDQRAAGEKD